MFSDVGINKKQKNGGIGSKTSRHRNQIDFRTKQDTIPTWPQVGSVPIPKVESVLYRVILICHSVRKRETSGLCVQPRPSGKASNGNKAGLD
jgi:hypothetical protein